MQKYFENLDDYTDHSPSRLMGFTKQFLPVVIFVAALLVILGTCARLEGL